MRSRVATQRSEPSTRAAATKVPAPSQNTVIVKAVSIADSSKSATVSVQIPNRVPSIVSMAPAQINSLLPFTLTLSGLNFTTTASVALDDNTPVTIVSRSGSQLDRKRTRLNSSHLGIW